MPSSERGATVRSMSRSGSMPTLFRCQATVFRAPGGGITMLSGVASDQEVLELEKLGCKLSVGETYLDDLQADVVFRTPGMHPNIPALRDLRDKGAVVTSEMEVFFELCPCTILAVTGSDGILGISSYRCTDSFDGI